MRRQIVTCAFAILSVALMAQETAKPIDYDTFCKLPDQQAKKMAFGATTAENRGTLARTHIERWRDANQARLDDKQKAVLAELLKSITADSYAAGPQGEEARVKSRAIVTNVESLFTRDDIMAMQFTEPCIPKK
jgi:hypothetical protein